MVFLFIIVGVNVMFFGSDVIFVCFVEEFVIIFEVLFENIFEVMATYVFAGVIVRAIG